MTCIIVEDQPPAQRILKKYIEDIGSLELQATFADALQAMEFLKSQPVDLVFLDIHLPKISGIDFLKTVPQLPHIILTTAFSEYALESYEFNVVDYLLKPYSFQRFVKAVSKVPRHGAAQPQPTGPESIPKEVYIKSGYEYIKVPLDQLLYICADADYTELVLPNCKHLSTEPLRHWAEVLDQPRFTRIHKSYIINTQCIKKVSSTKVELESGTQVPIGRAYKDAFMEQFLNKD